MKLARAVGQVAAMLGLALGGTAWAQPSEPPKLFVRCENVLPEPLRKSLFPGWTLEEGWNCPDCPTGCLLTAPDKRTLAQATYVCGGKPLTLEEKRAKAPTGAKPLEGLGTLSYHSTEGDMSRVDVWDEDSPCRVVFRWKGKAQDTRVVEFARAGAAAVTTENVSRPVMDALIWIQAAATPEGARRLTERLPQEKAAVESFLELSPGFPQVAPSGSAPGLGAGSYLVLGYCPVGTSGSLVEELEPLNPSVDVLRVERPATDATCPRSRDNARQMGTRSLKTGGKTLSVTLFGQATDENFLELTQVATLRDSKGTLLTTHVPERISVYNAFATSLYPCQSQLKNGQGGIVVETVCEWNIGGCRTNTVDRYTETFRVVKGAIQSTRDLKRREADCSSGD